MERAASMNPANSQEKDFDQFMDDLRQQVAARYGDIYDGRQTIEVVADARVLEVLARHHTKEVAL